MGLTLTTAPTIEPVALPLAKSHVGLAEDDVENNSILTTLIQAARARTEKHTGRAWITQSWTLTLDRFPLSCPIVLPKPPLITVTSILYDDSDGVEQTLSTSDYRVNSGRQPATIEPAINSVWPTTRDQSGAVRVLFQCGYGENVSDVPPDARAAMLLLIYNWFENPSSVVTGTIASELPQSATMLLNGLKTGIAPGQYNLNGAG